MRGKLKLSLAVIGLIAVLGIWIGQERVAADKPESEQLQLKLRYVTLVGTDKPIYRINETVLLRGVVLNAVNSTPLHSSLVVAAVELKNPQGNTVLTTQTSVENSVLTFHWVVPADAAGGQYKIKISYPENGFAPAERSFDVRAYRAPRLRNQITFLRDGYGPGAKVAATLHTERSEGGIPAGAKVNVMANVDGREIKGGAGVVDANGNCTVGVDLPEKLLRGEGTLALVVEDGGVVESASKTIPILLQSVDVKFYPEGGELVAGLTNRVYFEARQPNGKPADIVGEVIEESVGQPQKAASFRSEHEGRGRFEFAPKDGCRYSVRITEPAGILPNGELPAAKSKTSAATIHSDKDVYPQDIPIVVQVGHAPEKAGQLHVTLCKREVEIASQAFDAGPGKEAIQEVQFKPSPEVSGVLRITVWDAEGKPLAERLVFRQPARKLNLAFSLDKNSYIPGDGVKLTVKTTSADGRPASAVVGLTVTDDSVLQLIDKREQAPRLPVMAFLESEVKELADANLYFDTENAKSALATDLLLGTQGWRRFAYVDPEKFIASFGDDARRVLVLRGACPLLDDIIVPPDILARAELGDHFESINGMDLHLVVDRPDAHLFHDARFDVLGGGGMNGLALGDVIGIGGVGWNAGTGGGFGGGDGTGIGVGAGVGSFGSRNGGGRRLMVKRHGGSRMTEIAVDRALSWLAYHQEVDGHWDSRKFGADSRTDTSCTGLALLAFLGAGHSEKVGMYKDNVRRSIEWLKSQQRANGLIFSAGDDGGEEVGIPHAIAGMALSEAAALSRVLETRRAAQKAVQYSTDTHQSVVDGKKSGWGRKANGKVEMMATGWFLLQLKAARIAGLNADITPFEGALHGLQSLEDNEHRFRPAEGMEIAPLSTAIGNLACAMASGSVDELDPGVRWMVDAGGVPDWEKPGVLYWHFGTLCAFQTRGDTWKQWNDAMKKTLLENQKKEKDEAGSWACDDKDTKQWGRVGQTALNCGCLEVYYRYPAINFVNPNVQSAGNAVRYIREYAHAARPDRRPDDRTDFSETLYWNPTVKTDAVTGKATVRFALNDSVTSFRISADAFNNDGVLGEAVSEIHSVQPLYVEPKLPLEVTSGDIIRLPLNVVNSVGKDLPGTAMDVQMKGNFKISPIEPFDLKAADRARRIVNIEVGANNGAADFSVSTHAGEYTDSVTRKLTVKPGGFPTEIAAGGMLESSKVSSHDFNIPSSYPGSLRTKILVYPTPLANLAQALERLIVDPCGCFEQTSSTSYPLTMAQQYFMSHHGVDPKLIEASREKLQAGYKRLVSFWCPDRGYEWFGENPGHEALTAFGLLHFADMAKVRDVDQQMVAQTRAWLLKQRDGKGGFERKRRALHTWIEDKDCSDAYITWALLESGEQNLDAEIANVKRQASASANSYVVALVANVMALAGLKQDALACCDRLAQLQVEDGSVSGGQASIVGSTGEALAIETTALATLAWLRDDRYVHNVEKSIHFLAGSCKAGRYGSTQSTVLALRAIITYDKANARTRSAGAVRVLVDGKQVGAAVEFGPNSKEAIALPDIAEQLSQGEHNIRLIMDNGNTLPYSIAINYNAITPASSKSCNLDMAVKLSSSELTEGDAAQIDVTVSNNTAAAVPMSVVVVGLPGGLEPRHDQLKELVKKEKIDFYEVRGNEVVLYWRGLAANAKLEVPISVIAAVPGTYRGAASRAYLYYSDEHKKWVDGLTVKIAEK